MPHPVFSIPTAGILFLLLMACGSPDAPELSALSAESAAFGTEVPENPHSRIAEMEAAEPAPEKPGKEYFPAIGSYLTVPEGMQATSKGSEVSITRPDGQLRMNLAWYKDLASTFRKLVNEGIDFGDTKLASNGATEDLGNGRTGFVTILMDKSSLAVVEGRYHIVEPEEERGSFVGLVAITREDDVFFEQAKEQLRALMSTVEHLSATEAEALAQRERERQERRWQADLAAIDGRQRTPEEQQFRQALAGKALVKLTSESNSSSMGTDYFYSTERFDLCTDGQGTYDYSSRTKIAGMNTENDGTRYETGTMSGNSADHVTGAWDVSRDQRGFYLEIHTGEDAPGSWPIAFGKDGGFIVGGKQFWVKTQGSEDGPRCP